MTLVVTASGPRLVASSPCRPGQNLVGRLRGERLPESPEHMPNFWHGQGEEINA
jgi:hypothetical protein